MASTSLQLPSVKRFQEETQLALHALSGMKCTNDHEYNQCVNMFKWAKARKKEIKEETEYKELERQIEVLHVMHSKACTLRKSVLDPYDKVETAAENLMRPYVNEQKRLKEIEDRKKEEAARKAAEQEKELLRLQAEIEGNVEEAKIIESLPPAVAPVQSAPAVPKQEGMSTATVWKWRIVDLEAIPDIYWSLNEALINTTVKVNKEKTQIPGIEAYPDTTFRG